jgi:hypothetical protein
MFLPLEFDIAILQICILYMAMARGYAHFTNKKINLFTLSR